MSIYAEHKHSMRRIAELEIAIADHKAQIKDLEKELQRNKDMYEDSVAAMRDEARRERDDWRYHDYE